MSSSMSRPHTLQSTAAPSRRVLARDDAIALGQKLLGLVSGRASGVSIVHTSRAVTKVANGAVLNMDDGDVVSIKFQSAFGAGMPVFMYTNQLQDAPLRQVLTQVAGMEPPTLAWNESEPPDDPDDPRHYVYNARELPRVSLWRDPTIRAMDTVRGEVIPKLVEQMRASKLTGAATVGLMARSVLHMYRLGLTSYAEETDCEVTVTARTPDGTASGWGGQAHRDWTRIATATAIDQAVEMANRSRNAVALEPGRRTAILGPAAVAQLVFGMARLFDAGGTVIGGTPFSVIRGAGGRHTKLGMPVFDPRIMMVSDPADPDGGYPPFFEDGGKEMYLLGFPTPAVTWIDHGVLKRLSYSIDEAATRRLTPSEDPYSVRLTTVPGTKTATIDEMIANCQEGVYVNRFSDVQLIDQPSGMMTGVTRDGCFYVKNGKIEKPIKNFRFTDSPFFAFNNLELIGAAERVAFGNTAPLGVSWFRRGWPRLPVIVPPMMARDFNFSALSSAV